MPFHACRLDAHSDGLRMVGPVTWNLRGNRIVWRHNGNEMCQIQRRLDLKLTHIHFDQLRPRSFQEAVQNGSSCRYRKIPSIISKLPPPAYSEAKEGQGLDNQVLSLSEVFTQSTASCTTDTDEFKLTNRYERLWSMRDAMQQSRDRKASCAWAAASNP